MKQIVADKIINWESCARRFTLLNTDFEQINKVSHQGYEVLDIAERDLFAEYPTKPFVAHLSEKLKDYQVDFGSDIQTAQQWTPPQRGQLITFYAV